MTYGNNDFKKISPPLKTVDSNYNKDPVDGYAFEDSTLWLGTRFNKFLRFDGKTLNMVVSQLRCTSGVKHLLPDLPSLNK